MKNLITNRFHLHIGHEGAKEGGSHFAITIVSKDFEGKSRIDRHRMVYDALAEMMSNHIHALKITALSPNEY